MWGRKFKPKTDLPDAAKYREENPNCFLQLLSRKSPRAVCYDIIMIGSSGKSWYVRRRKSRWYANQSEEHFEEGKVKKEELPKLMDRIDKFIKQQGWVCE